MELGVLLWLALGLIVLVAGAEVFIRGAVGLAEMLGFSPLVIGLTVVALGTSAPELAISVRSALAGQPDLALGNIVGSNIANVLLILGLSAAVAPLVVSAKMIWMEVPIMLALSVLVLFLGYDGGIGRLDGVALTACGMGYLGLQLYGSRTAPRELRREYGREYPTLPARSAKDWLLRLAQLIGGLGLLLLGANWMVDSAVALARNLGVSELVIGLTVVAIGTSLPELATSVIASFKGERDLAVGNVVGSNILNIGIVLGITSAAAPAGVPVGAAALGFDLPVMIAVAAACLPIFFHGHAILRWEGFVFLGCYAAYTTYLVLTATRHHLLPLFSGVMLWFALPLVGLTLVVITVRQARGKPNGLKPDAAP